MSKKTINPKELFKSTDFGFSQIIVTEPGKHVFFSGQAAWDENMNIVGKDNLKIQTQKAIENIKTAIETVGGTLDNVVLLRIYKVKLKRGEGAIISEVLKENFGTETPPVSTWISVDGLASEDFLIETEAEAII